jgi:MYXO-CTERM domain-containing protein
VWINTTDLKPNDAIGEIVTSVGFGLTETGDSGQKRSAPLVVADLDPMFLISNNNENENGANICSGDSGGPQFHDDPEGPDGTPGERLQWAVHSWGDLDCRFTSGSTRTDVVADFILDQVEAVHGTRDFCAIMGRYDDGICQTTCDEPDPDCEIDDAAADGAEAKGCGCDTGGAGALAPIMLSTTALAAAALWGRRRSLRSGGAS